MKLINCIDFWMSESVKGKEVNVEGYANISIITGGREQDRYSCNGSVAMLDLHTKYLLFY